MTTIDDRYPPQAPRLLAECAAGCRERRATELRTVWRLLKHLEAAGFHPVCIDHDDRVRVTTHEETIDEVFAVDDCVVRFNPAAPICPSPDGRLWVRIVLGNDGDDCLADANCPPAYPAWNATIDAFGIEPV